MRSLAPLPRTAKRTVSCRPSFVVKPDGRIAGWLALHRERVLVTTIDTRAKFYDASAEWRGRAVRGTLHSGQTIRDPRSSCRTGL